MALQEKKKKKGKLQQERAQGESLNESDLLFRRGRRVSVLSTASVACESRSGSGRDQLFRRFFSSDRGRFLFPSSFIHFPFVSLSWFPFPSLNLPRVRQTDTSHFGRCEQKYKVGWNQRSFVVCSLSIHWDAIECIHWMAMGLIQCVRSFVRQPPSTAPDDATLNQKKSRRFFPLILNVAKKKKKMMILSRNFLHTVYTHTEEAEYKSKRQEPWHRRPLRRNPLEWTAHNGPWRWERDLDGKLRTAPSSSYHLGLSLSLSLFPLFVLFPSVSDFLLLPRQPMLGTPTFYLFYQFECDQANGPQPHPIDCMALAIASAVAFFFFQLDGGPGYIRSSRTAYIHSVRCAIKLFSLSSHAQQGEKEMRPIVTCTHIERNNWWKMLTLQLLTCRGPIACFVWYVRQLFWLRRRQIQTVRLECHPTSSDCGFNRIWKCLVSVSRYRWLERILINGEGNTTIFESIDISFLFLSILVPDGRTDWYFSFSIRPFTVDGAPVMDDILLAYYPPLLSLGFSFFSSPLMSTSLDALPHTNIYRPIYIYISICVCLCCIDVDVSARDTDSMTRWMGANDRLRSSAKETTRRKKNTTRATSLKTSVE